MEIKFSAGLTVAAFGSWYMFEHLRPPKSKGDWKSDRKFRLNTTQRAFRTWLKREPLVSDLSRETVAAFLEHVGHGKNWKTIRDLVRALRKVAISKALIPPDTSGTLLCEVDRRQQNGRKNARGPLSEADGTLWHLCRQRYFPTNLRIRSAQTRKIYRLSLADLRAFTGREPTRDDLTDENVTVMMVMLRDKGLQPRTVNERRNRLCALWTWMAKKRLIEEFPAVCREHEPKRTPRAWTAEQIQKLFLTCDQETGHIGSVPAGLWWRAIHFMFWDTAERVSAVLDMKWQHVDLEAGNVNIPAEIRKGQGSDASYRLCADTIEVLRQLRDASAGKGPDDNVFPWPYHKLYIWVRYGKLLKRAGLPHDRASKFHRMRRSVASHMQAAGHDASAALGHSSSAITKKSYLDPNVCGEVSPSQVLFRPNPSSQE